MTVSAFRDVTGHLVPRVWCSGHDLAPTRKIFEINDIDTASGLVSMMIWPFSNTHTDLDNSRPCKLTLPVAVKSLENSLSACYEKPNAWMNALPKDLI
jgi:hypothetical protein